MQTYATHPYPVLVEGTPLHHVGFQAVVDLWHELEGESLGQVSHRPDNASLRFNHQCTFSTVVAGMQCVSRSYSLARTCKILAGERSSTISFAMTSMSASQSGGGIGVFSLTLSLLQC